MTGSTAPAPGPRVPEAIRDAFQDFRRRFQGITQRARGRFEERDWHGMQDDAIERLDLYPRVIAGVVEEVRDLLGPDATRPAAWAPLKPAYRGMVEGWPDIELALTFYNSVSRRLLGTLGVLPEVEFLSHELDAPSGAAAAPVYDAYPVSGPLEEAFRRVLRDLPFAGRFAYLEGDARRIAAAASWASPGGEGEPIEAVEMLHSVFYRGKGAYLVGRLRRRGGLQALVVPLLHDERGVVADAVLPTQDEASIVFGFTRSYFHAEVPHPREVIRFLKTIMPVKRVAELYIALGFHKHGKTELYRDLLRHLERSRDRFEIARGDAGMVMVVFTMPSYDMVLKVIRDHIAYPKSTTRAEVMDRYRFVFRHDRAGRLVDAQEFENLSFAVDRFASDLLDELLRAAPDTVTVRDGAVHIRHLYVERRLTPLNLFLRESDEAAALEAVVDYGQAVKDMAAANVFPGDLLLKNFGLSRHGRVIFYDYDELCRITDCNFRELPAAPDGEETSGGEPWFYVDRDDVFPEEFASFLGLREDLRRHFLEHHADLFTVEFWTRMKRLHEAGELVDIFPYRALRRLAPWAV